MAFYNKSITIIAVALALLVCVAHPAAAASRQLLGGHSIGHLINDMGKQARNAAPFARAGAMDMGRAEFGAAKAFMGGNVPPGMIANNLQDMGQQARAAAPFAMRGAGDMAHAGFKAGSAIARGFFNHGK